MNESDFFPADSETICNQLAEPELIYNSENGWSQLFLTDKNGRFRVLKALKPEFRGNALYETFLKKEFEISYHLSHPGICETYGFSQVAGLGNCIEMEWIDGENLGTVLGKRMPDKNESISIILQLCDALEYCHSKQVLHRDVKPGNIMITHSGGRVKLIDFSLSDSDSHSVFKTACGTKEYAPPEALDGGVLDEKSDIYSLGKVIQRLHPAFRRIAGRCIEASPEKRYRNISSLREAVLKSRKRESRVYLAAAALPLLAASLFVVRTLTRSSADLQPGQQISLVDTLPSVSAAAESTVDSIIPATIPVRKEAVVPQEPSSPVPAAPHLDTPDQKESDQPINEAALDEIFTRATELFK